MSDELSIGQMRRIASKDLTAEGAHAPQHLGVGHGAADGCNKLVTCGRRQAGWCEHWVPLQNLVSAARQSR